MYIVTLDWDSFKTNCMIKTKMDIAFIVIVALILGGVNYFFPTFSKVTYWPLPLFILFICVLIDVGVKKRGS